MKNKGFLLNKIVSARLGNRIRESKSTTKRRKVTRNRDILGVSNGAGVGEVVNVVGVVVDLLEAARKVHLVGTIQITLIMPELGLAEQIPPDTIAEGVKGVLREVMSRVTHNAMDQRGSMIGHRGVVEIALWRNKMLHRAFIS